MKEPVVMVFALAFSAILVWLVHSLVMPHVNVGSQSEKSNISRTILSMEVVAFGALLAAFVLGEVGRVALAVIEGSPALSDFNLSIKDLLLVFASLLGSLLIYTTIRKMQ